jgi:uncharacterized membrane protein YbaN (DUF454 family)
MEMKGTSNTKIVRHILFVTGVLCLILAILGFLLPLLPGTPFLLLAMACFSRSSEKMHRWILSWPGVGPMLESWERDGSIPIRAKILATIMMVLATLYPLFFEGLPAFTRCIAGTACLLLLLFIWTRPSR